MEVNGIAHIQLTVNDFAACREFYRKLTAFLEMKPVLDVEGYFYAVGSRTGLLISPADEAFRGERFEQRRIGLHHVCFRARSREDVDALFWFLLEIGATIVHPPEEGPWAPGYYSVLFEDPDGIRLEANFVAGRGLLDPNAGPPSVG